MLTFTTLLVLVALLVLVEVGQADALGYGDPANFVLRTNANGRILPGRVTAGLDGARLDRRLVDRAPRVLRDHRSNHEKEQVRRR